MNCNAEVAQQNVNGVDVVDDACMDVAPVASPLVPDSKKDNVLERINKRNKDRQNYLDVKRNKENLQFEGADYFAQTFGERVREIETRIKNIADIGPKKTTLAMNNAEMNNSELGRLFSSIACDIQELERYLTTSTIFLTDYKIKACQKMLSDLTASCEETRIKLLPKKKFGFSGRKVAPKGFEINPKLSTDKLDCSPEKCNTQTTANANMFTWTLANRSRSYIRLSGAEVDGKDITISHLSNCFVELQGHAGSVQISHATDCIFLFGPISRSLFAEFCQSCTFASACQQLRLHSSTAVRVYLHVTGRAIIEDCKQIEIGEYCYDYPDIENDFLKADLDKTHNNYTDVADFNWLSPEMHSPNWILLKDSSARMDWSELRSNFKEKIADKSI